MKIQRSTSHLEFLLLCFIFVGSFFGLVAGAPFMVLFIIAARRYDPSPLSDGK